MTLSSTDAVIAGRYEVGPRVGQGGMGTVFRGVDSKTGEPVAIKLLNPESLLHDPSNLERFGREGEALRRLNHPNIVKVLTAVQEGERRYLVMEWVGGGSLEDLLRSSEAPLPVDRVLRIALDLGDALTRSHRLDIVHRDIKPANVLIADDGTPRLTDFGVAHVVGEKSVTIPNVIVGTLDYMSPEVLRGEPVDARTDVWAFGVLLFEMLTRKRPFSEAHFAHTLYAIANKPTPDLESFRPDCPSALVDLVYRMLEKHKEQRIPSVRQVGAELENILTGRIGPRRPANAPTSDSASPETVTLLSNAPTTPSGRAWHGTEHGALASRDLPVDITPFIGRTEELAKLAWLLTDPNARAITIVGPGGVGKSRFALEVGRRIRERIGAFGETLGTVSRFEDGVFFVPLASLGSPELVCSAIAEAIGLDLRRGEDPVEQLLRYVRNKAMLLVLDNFEHVLQSAGLVGDLLRAAPRSLALVTSRERLGLAAETIFDLGGMEVPRTETSVDRLRYSAVDLFVACAQRANAAFELTIESSGPVTRICRLVGGMPLGIVLSASWAGVMTPDEIADEIAKNLDFLTSEMRDVPERQRSLRAAFDHSWKLLDERQREAFSRLCVFRGGFTRSAAEAVADASVRILVTLTNKSLLRRDAGSGRYEIHELLRQYAEEKLTESPANHERTLGLHTDYYAAFIAERTKGLGVRQGQVAEREHRVGAADDREPVVMLDEIGTEIDNLRAAWKHMLACKLLEPLAVTLSGFAAYYRHRATYVEAESVFAAAVQSLGASREKPSGEEARLLGMSLSLQAAQFGALSRPSEAIGLCNEALLLLDGNLHPIERADVLLRSGISNADLGNIKQATAQLEQALALFRKANDWIGAGWSLNFLGNVVAWNGDYEKSEGPLRESVTIHEQAAPNSVALLHSLIGLGSVMAGQGDYEEGSRLLSLGLQMNEAFGDIGSTLNGHLYLASARRSLGDYAGAETLARRFLTLAEEFGASHMKGWAWMTLGHIMEDQGLYVDAAVWIEKAQRLDPRNESPRRAAIGRLVFGNLALLQGDYAVAEAIFLRELAWFEEHEVFWAIVMALDGLGHVACHQGNLALARDRFGRALATALACKARPSAHRVAAGVALWLRKTGHPVRAVELLGRIRSDSATERATHTQLIDPLLAELEKELPADEFAVALERGKTFDLEALRDELCRTAP